MRASWTALGLVLALWTLPEAVRAQDDAEEPVVAPDVPPGDDVIEHLALRAPAPFEGMLLDMDTSIRWTHRIEWYRAELLVQHRTRISLLAAERHSHEVELTLTRESYEREITGLRTDLREQAAAAAQALAQAREHPWYDTFSFGLTIGVLASALLVGVTAGLLGSI